METTVPPGPAGEDNPSRRRHARLLVVVDGSAQSTRRLAWALQEADRQDAIVLAVVVLGSDAGDEERWAARTLLDAQLRHAIGLTGVSGRGRTALVDEEVHDALASAATGDLVIVRTHGTTVPPPAPPRIPAPRTSAARS